jgi:hypothetical protein
MSKAQETQRAGSKLRASPQGAFVSTETNFRADAPLELDDRYELQALTAGAEPLTGQQVDERFEGIAAALAPKADSDAQLDLASERGQIDFLDRYLDTRGNLADATREQQEGFFAAVAELTKDGELAAADVKALGDVIDQIHAPPPLPPKDEEVVLPQPYEPTPPARRGADAPDENVWEQLSGRELADKALGLASENEALRDRTDVDHLAAQSLRFNEDSSGTAREQEAYLAKLDQLTRDGLYNQQDRDELEQWISSHVWPSTNR